MSTRFFRPRVLAAVVVPTLLLAGRWQGKDITFDILTKTEGTTSNGMKVSLSKVTRVMASPTNGRSERVPSDSSQKPDTVLVSLNSGNTVIVIDNTTRTYSRT